MELLNAKQLVDLSSKTAIVTGGAVGIGFGIACRLAEAGANVVVVDINKENAEKAVQELTGKGWKAVAVQTDVSNGEDVGRMVAAAVHAFGSVDILVNNAGIYPSKLVMDMEEKDFDRVIAVNLKSVFLCSKAAAGQMIAQGKGGRIINITSIDALHPSSMGLAHYDASKHGVWGFTKNIALELAPHRIWVNAVAPGGIATPGVAAQQKGMPAPGGVDMDAMLKAFLEKIPMGRMGEPDDIGRAALFLASDLSSYMTGTQIVVDGGYLLR
jgi:2-dehydro-3-deoxy-D-gluconate 5-dehydrogenase